MCTANTVDEALSQVKGLMSMGHNLPAYAYMRMLYAKNPALYFSTLLAKPSELLPVVYTPVRGTHVHCSSLDCNARVHPRRTA